MDPKVLNTTFGRFLERALWLFVVGGFYTVLHAFGLDKNVDVPSLMHVLLGYLGVKTVVDFRNPDLPNWPE